MPRFSIVMPTYNRADTLARAIDSVRAQRFGDWELWVVDDGSTDDTPELLRTYASDARIHVIRQDHRGVAWARNAALAAAQGELLAFLDSDDEWPAHHLELMSAFFEAHPGEHVATTEWWEDLGNGTQLQHFQVEMREWYPAAGKRIGAERFKSPPPQDDPVLWFYETRAPLGDWAKQPLGPALREGAFHYRGKLFSSGRYGWLAALQPTVLTRTALMTVGRFDERYRVASDFTFLARLFKAFPMNFFSVPGCIKHDRGVDGKALVEGHLVAGKTELTFHHDVLRGFEELYLPSADPETDALHGLRQVLAAKAALKAGERALAQEWLEQAAQTWPGLDTSALLMLARAELDAQASAAIYLASSAALRLPARLTDALQRLIGSVVPAPTH